MDAVAGAGNVRRSRLYCARLIGRLGFFCVQVHAILARECCRPHSHASRKNCMQVLHANFFACNFSGYTYATSCNLHASRVACKKFAQTCIDVSSALRFNRLSSTLVVWCLNGASFISGVS